ncbi:hypothetical protein BDV30DRAFT_17390 [Aspergillus minisclerotigenes]|uniref:Uncharacterized protein n=1 Tax=Aspergillus minisclerotigenes TaxID=656917 RepID=A0A5N6JFF1_9EURO|nr:hypothetical protein BDV30DRAFT_17390 [Aspergillus minisclerotigenes]
MLFVFLYHGGATNEQITHFPGRISCSVDFKRPIRSIDDVSMPYQMHESPKTIKVFTQDVARWDRMTKLWYSLQVTVGQEHGAGCRRRVIGTAVRPINEDIGMLRGFPLLVYVRQALLQAVRSGILVSSASPPTPPMTRQHHMHPSNTRTTFENSSSQPTQLAR